MVRLIVFLIGIAVAASGLSWLADRPGSLLINWQGHEIETSVFRAVVMLAFVIGLAILTWSIIAALWRSPASIGMFFNRRRQMRGIEALSGGIIALGAGDRDTATRFAVQARKALPNEPLTHLLRAQAAQLPVRGYISCVIRCPYDGVVDPAQVVTICARMLELGVDELDLGDTIGAADPDSISRLYDAIAVIIEPRKTTLHLHDTHGRAIACACRALEIGVRSFDASVGGLGGCPYAPGSRGNVATETLARAIVNAGFDPHIDIQRAAEAGLWMRQQLASTREASI